MKRRRCRMCPAELESDERGVCVDCAGVVRNIGQAHRGESLVNLTAEQQAERDARIAAHAARVGGGIETTGGGVMGDTFRVLFLDVDGVLNGHDWHEGARSNTLRRSCIDQLSRILQETDCRIVLSSAWRYLIHCKAMTVLGFEAMLRSHGACGIVGKIIGVTRKDEDCCHCGHCHRKGHRGDWNDAGYFVCRKCKRPSTRGDQIKAWRFGNALVPLTLPEGMRSTCAALDDEDFGITQAGIPLVQTDGACGLTEADAGRTIKLLMRRRRRP